MYSQRNRGFTECLSPDATKEQMAEWSRMVKELEERTKQQMNQERKCCGNCYYHTPPWEREFQPEWTCGNEESDNYGLITDYVDCCQDFESRKEEVMQS